MSFSIAIDGPSGAGKSTLARMLAGRLGYLYVDTGAIYRTVGLAARRSGTDPDCAGAVEALLPGLSITMNYDGAGVQHMYLNGEDVTQAIRTSEISRYASKVSAIPAVRAFLLEMQRSLARQHNVIMDGRDIGTVVLPDATLKIFLTADAADRARRRCAELQEKGEHIDFQQVYQDVLERDERDTRRAAAPLRRAQDAVEVNTTGNTLDESFQALLAVVNARLGGEGGHE